MELKTYWTALDVKAAPEGSAYAEFWLNAPGRSEPQLALAGVVSHIGPVLQELLHPTPKHQRDTGEDQPATAP